MQRDLMAPLSAAGLLSIIVSVGTIVSSLWTPALLRLMGTGKLVFISIALTAVASFGYGISNSFAMMCLFAIPMGIGAGAIDVAMNNFAAIYLESKHTSWLHASWGVGACLGPALFSISVVTGVGWRGAYDMVALLLALIAVMMLITLPIWKKMEKRDASQQESAVKDISLRAALKVPGMKLSFWVFFFYSSLEISTSLWCGTYLVARGFEPEIGAIAV
jgi:MFS family permease